MDSLFEGMVLFSPANTQDPTTTDNEQTTTVELEQQQRQQEKEEEEIIKTTRTTSEALEEDLFSDLTLNEEQYHTTPISITTTTPTPTTTSPSLTRQVSNTIKRKKKSSFKIGYARHYDTISDQRQLSESAPPKDVCFTAPDQNPLHKITTFEPQHDHHHHNLQLKVSTSAETFDRLKHQISEKLLRSRELMFSVSAERKDSIKRRNKAAENVSQVLVKYRDIERELEEACEAEDFERADSLSHSLASAENAKGEMLRALRIAEGECDAVDGKMQRAFELQIATEEECALLLHHFSMCAANEAESVLRKADIESSKELDDWLSSIEALQLKKLEMEIESHLVDDARKLMDSSIETSMEDEVKEKERLCQKKDVLVDELEKLLALVKAKEKEIAENDASIEAIENRISNAVSGFEEAKSSIDARYDNIQSGLSQMDMESESLSIKKKEIDEFINKEENRGTQLKELAKRSSDEAKEYQDVIGLRKSLMRCILKSRDDKARLAKTEEQLSEDVQELQIKVSAARASLQELSSTKSSVQQNIASVQERIFSIGKRLPELEAEKKVAATARNFKEAARISAEAKSLTNEKDGLQNDLEKAILQVEKLEGEIKETVSELEETEGSILSKEKEVAMARVQKLLLVVGAATAERSAAIELGFDEEASLYLAEANAAQTEAMKLKQEYNFEEEEFACLPKHFISMELVSSLGREKLENLAASVKVSAPS